jgi:hypothetical protein
MIRGSIFKALLAVSIAAGIAVTAILTQAGSAGNGTAGTGLPQFKNLSLFRHEADAQKQCPADKVVWGSREHIGVYYVKGAGPYYDRGAGPQRIAGYYACMADAKKAGYQIGE